MADKKISEDKTGAPRDQLKKGAAREEIELGWVRLVDRSDLVLTNLHVFQHKDNGFLGESKSIVRRDAITAVRLGWQRSRAALGTAIALFSVYLILMLASLMLEPPGISSEEQENDSTAYAYELLNSSGAAAIRYGALIGGIGLLALFWFYRRNEIQVVAPSGTLGGIPRDYQEAQKFCSLLLSGTTELPPPRKEDKKAAEPKPAGETEWRL